MLERVIGDDVLVRVANERAVVAVGFARLLQHRADAVHEVHVRFPRRDLATLNELHVVLDVRLQRRLVGGRRCAENARPRIGQRARRPVDLGVRRIGHLEVRLQPVEVRTVLVDVEVPTAERDGRQLRLELGLRGLREADLELVDVDRAEGRVEILADVHPPSQPQGGAVRPVLVERLEPIEQRVELVDLVDDVRVAVFPAHLPRLRGEALRVVYELEVLGERVDRRDDEERREEQRRDRERKPIDELTPLLRSRARPDVLIGEDDAAKKVGDEVALRLRLRLLDGLRRGEVEGAHHPADDAVDGAPLLRAAREVDAAEDGRLLEVVRLEERRGEFLEVLLQRREFERELVDALPHVDLPLGADTLKRACVEPLDQQIELFVERLRQIALRDAVERERRPPDLRALALAEVAPELHEPGHEVDLREGDVDGDDELEPRHHLVHPGAQAFRVAVDLLVGRSHQVGDVDDDDHAVDRLA